MSRKDPGLGLSIYVVTICGALLLPTTVWGVDGSVGATSTGSAEITVVINTHLEPVRTGGGAGATGGTCLRANDPETRYEISIPQRGGGGRRVAGVKRADRFADPRCSPIDVAALPRGIGDEPVVLFLPAV